MINLNRVETGFDFEFQIGANFFHQAILTYVLAGEIPSNIGGISIGPPSTVRLFFDDQSNPEDEPWDIEVDVAASGPGIPGSITVTLFLALDIEPIQNPRTCAVDKVNFNLRYVKLSNLVFGFLANNDPNFNREEFDQNMHALLDRKLPAFLPGRFDRIHVRKLQGEPDFQDCYSILVNLKLNLAPVNDFITVNGHNLPIPADPRGEQVSREEDPQRALPFLPHDLDIAIAAPPEIYSRLSSDVIHSLTVALEGGKFSRPLMDGDEKKGQINNVSIQPVFKAPSLSSIGPPVSLDQIRIKTDLQIQDPVDVDVEQVTIIVPEITPEGEIDLDINVRKPKVDSFMLEILTFSAIVVVFSAVPGLLVILGAAGALSILGASAYAGALASILPLYLIRKEIEESKEQSKENIERQFESRGGGLNGLFAAIPSRITMINKRVDPFYLESFQVRTHFKEVKIGLNGMGFGGTVFATSEEETLRKIKIRSRSRLTEPNGDLIELEYSVPNHNQIIDIDQFKRLDPIRYPDVFALPMDAIEQRLKNKRIAGVWLSPKRVRKSGSRIAEFLFDDGVALSPVETANLDLIRGCRVWGAKLIQPRRGNPYYRSKRDRRESNNLAALPEFSSFRATQLAEKMQLILEKLLTITKSLKTEIWFWEFESDQLKKIPPAVYHLWAALVKMVEWQALFAARSISSINVEDRDFAVLSVNDDPTNFLADDLFVDIEEQQLELLETIYAFNDVALNRNTERNLFGPNINNYEWGYQYLNWAESKLREINNLINLATEQHHIANPGPASVDRRNDLPDCDPPPAMP